MMMRTAAVIIDEDYMADIDVRVLHQLMMPSLLMLADMRDGNNNSRRREVMMTII